jgi:hypothetical protein
LEGASVGSCASEPTGVTVNAIIANSNSSAFMT